MADVSITISFREILRDVCQQFSLASPVYGVPVEDDDMFTVRVDVEYVGENAVVETFRGWGGPSATIDEAEESAAHRAVEKLREEFQFEVVNFNLAGNKFYENLYTRLSTDHAAVQKKYKQLKRDYNILRSYYAELLTEKERFVAEREKLKERIDRCSALLSRSNDETPHQDSSAGNSELDPLVPPGFGAQ